MYQKCWSEDENQVLSSKIGGRKKIKSILKILEIKKTDNLLLSEILLPREAHCTAVSAGHQSKSCSVYKKCEDIFFLEPFYFVTIFLPRSFLKISECHLQENFEVENHLNPPKQQNHWKPKKKVVSMRASIYQKH